MRPIYHNVTILIFGSLRKTRVIRRNPLVLRTPDNGHLLISQFKHRSPRGIITLPIADSVQLPSKQCPLYRELVSLLQNNSSIFFFIYIIHYTEVTTVFNFPAEFCTLITIITYLILLGSRRREKNDECFNTAQLLYRWTRSKTIK